MFITEMITWLQHNDNIMMQLQWITIIREVLWDTQICSTLQIHHVRLFHSSRQKSKFFTLFYPHVWEFQAWSVSFLFFLDCAQSQREEMVLVEGVSSIKIRQTRGKAQGNNKSVGQPQPLWHRSLVTLPHHLCQGGKTSFTREEKRIMDYFHDCNHKAVN